MKSFKQISAGLAVFCGITGITGTAILIGAFHLWSGAFAQTTSAQKQPHQALSSSASSTNQSGGQTGGTINNYGSVDNSVHGDGPNIARIRNNGDEETFLIYKATSESLLAMVGTAGLGESPSNDDGCFLTGVVRVKFLSTTTTINGDTWAEVTVLDGACGGKNGWVRENLLEY